MRDSLKVPVQKNGIRKYLHRGGFNTDRSKGSGASSARTYDCSEKAKKQIGGCEKYVQLQRCKIQVHPAKNSTESYFNR
jgi:hypothetical protein